MDFTSPITVDVLIVGAGFSGLGMAIELRRKAPDLTFLLLEKSAGIGGTWWENHYPGCACDIPAHLYSYSFERNPGWSRIYAPQPEIQQYLQNCAAKYEILPHIRFNSRLTEATWDETNVRWRATTSDGLEIVAGALVSAVGALHVPSVPKLDGIEQFKGPVFHSAEWDHSVDLANKNVAVVGTGASAIQFVPQIAKQCAHLSVFQRTPPWIIPRLDYEISAKWRRRFQNWPGATWLLRELIFWLLEIRVLSFLHNGRFRRMGVALARKHLAKQVADPVLRDALTPRYEMGCKRVLVSSDYYPALTRPNVELVTQPIKEVTQRGIVAADGRNFPADVIIFGTGFNITAILDGVRTQGRNGVLLNECWRERPQAYLGITVGGFPNFFVLLGPNTGLGHNSVVLMIEAQIRYVRRCLQLLRLRKKRALDIRPERLKQFMKSVDARLETTVWQSGGCASWYRNGMTGENIAIWPGSVVSYILRTRRPFAADYLFID